MRIALDARTIYRTPRRGTGKNLIDLYQAVAKLRPGWMIDAYHRPVDTADAPMPEKFVKRRSIDLVGDRLDAWQRWRLPLAAWRNGADLLHCPANTCPSWMPLPTLVTIHDLIPLDMPAGRAASSVRRFEQSVRTAARRAAGIICPSHYTADRLIREFGAEPGRITVNHWAPDQSMRLVSPHVWPRVLEKYGVQSPFVLHFGASAPRKNTARMIESWAMLHSHVRKRWQLLVIGLDKTIMPQCVKRVEQLNLNASVRLHGFADEADLPALLSAADVLAYPSLSEGFGLPVLDAWATHTAVLTSDRTSLPEIAGDAAVLVDPTDAWAIAGKLETLLEDASLRQTLVGKGGVELEKYTWTATADRFVNAAERAIGLVGTRRRAA